MDDKFLGKDWELRLPLTPGHLLHHTEYDLHADFLRANPHFSYLPYDQRPMEAVPPAYRGYGPPRG